MTTIDSFYKRLKKIGIHVEMIGNYPWVYMDRVNGKEVRGDFEGNHGFTIFFRATRMGQEDTITDVTTIFKKIRETLCYDNN
jgi:hypothetical protein